MTDGTPPLTETQRRAYARNIWLSYAFEFVSNVQLWWPIWVIYLQQERHLSLTQITALDAPFFLAQIVAEVPTGAFADRFGRKLSLIVGGFSFAGAIFVFGVAENYLIILLSYLIWAVASAFRSGADAAILFDSLKLLGRTEEYAKIQGRSMALMPVAVIIGGLIGAPLAEATSLSTPVVLSAAFALGGAFIAMAYREPPFRSEDTTMLGTMVTAARFAFRRATIRYCLIYGTVLGVVSYAPVILLQPFLVGHGASIASLGILQTPVRLVGALGFLFAYRVVLGLGQWRTLTLLPILGVIAYGGLAAFDSIYALAFFPLISLAGSLRQVATVDYVNQRIPSEQRATVLSFRALLFALVVAGVEPALGATADVWSLRMAFLATALFGLLALGPLLAAWRRAEARETHEQTGKRASEPV